MTFLQNVLKSLKDNVARLEHEIEQHNLGTPQLWDTDAPHALDDPEHLIPWPAFNSIEKLCLDARALEAAVIPSHFKLLQLGLQPARSSALNVAVSLGIADAIEELQGSATLPQLAEKLAVNEHKLGKIPDIGLRAGLIFWSRSRHSCSYRRLHLPRDVIRCVQEQSAQQEPPQIEQFSPVHVVAVSIFNHPVERLKVH